MHIRAPAVVCAARPHGEAAVIVRLLTAEHGMMVGYVAGGRGRDLRPVLIPGNLVEADIRARSDSQLPFVRLELVQSRGPWLGEPLQAGGIAWVTALASATLPERQPYPVLHEALTGLLDAICLAPSARAWVGALLSYELLVIRELGYGVPELLPDAGDWPAMLHAFDRLGRQLERYPLAHRRADVMGARAMLRERLAKMG